MTVTAPKNNQMLPLPWPKEGLWSGPRPFVTLGPYAEVMQQPPKNKLQELPRGRVALSGRLLAPYGEDRFRVAVLPRQKVRFEVFAERIGSPVDAALIIRDDKGDIRACAEDSPGSLDPVLEVYGSRQDDRACRRRAGLPGPCWTTRRLSFDD